MRSMIVYSALKKHIRAKWPEQYITRGFIDYERDNDLGIFVRDIAPLRSRLNGRKYNGRLARVQFLFQATQSDEDFYNNRSFMFALEEYLLQMQGVELVTENNYTFDETDTIIRVAEPTEENKGIIIGIGDTSLVSSVVDIGKSPDGRPVFSINIAITYYIGGNKQ